ncbi:MAG: dTMP kinase [Candidatus Protochlamydia sp.]|nr:dTMP kinase [Candidatus Protochlamydia sp.]
MNDMSSRGHFITIEGGEGSGKSTLLHSLAAHLSAAGYDVVQTREPGGSKLGEFIRGWLLDHDDSVKIGKEAELLLFLAARAQHIEEKICPAIESGKIVLCDRFNDSTIAYQGAARGLTREFVTDLCFKVCGKTVPELTFFLDVDPEVGLKRTYRLQKESAASGKFDRIESETLSFHQRVQKAFQDLARLEPQRIYRLDANRSQAEVLEETLRLLESHLSFQVIQ